MIFNIFIAVSLFFSICFLLLFFRTFSWLKLKLLWKKTKIEKDNYFEDRIKKGDKIYAIREDGKLKATAAKSQLRAMLNSKNSNLYNKNKCQPVAK